MTSPYAGRFDNGEACLHVDDATRASPEALLVLAEQLITFEGHDARAVPSDAVLSIAEMIGGIPSGTITQSFVQNLLRPYVEAETEAHRRERAARHRMRERLEAAMARRAGSALS